MVENRSATEAGEGSRMVSLHVPVMKQEVVDMLRAQKGGAFLDCTFGGGGHTEALLAANAMNQVIAIDRDADAVTRAASVQQLAAGRLEVHHAAFSDLMELFNSPRFDGMLADLGLSSDQLQSARGFSFADSAPLDMRMDQRQELTAHTLVNGLSARDLIQLLRAGGVGPEALGIAHAIVRARPINDTKTLAEVVARAARMRGRKAHIHPATLTFQALRMAVNDELSEINTLLDAAPMLIRSGGRLAVITFHSLEDKAVTQRMRLWQRPEWDDMGKGPPPQSLGRLLTRHALRPLMDEIEANPSARSARLRVFEFIGG